MQADGKRSGELFDDWPARYNQWFQTPVGILVKKYETELLHQMLQPRPRDFLLDVGCGTGIFTRDVLAAGAMVIGIDISLPMLDAAVQELDGQAFFPVACDMQKLPFASGSFDKVYSMTALEFVDNGQAAVAELERVTRTGGSVVLTTLNSLSPWAERRRIKGQDGHSLFENMIFRSPAQMRRLVPQGADLKTSIYFRKDDDPARIPQIEAAGRSEGTETGAFLAVSWTKKMQN